MLSSLKNNFKPKWLLVLLISMMCFCVLVILILLFIFSFYFYDNNFTDNPETLGQFGDFIGGSLNPPLAIMNICIFIILTVIIQNLSNTNNDNNIKIQREIALMSLRFDELKKFTKQIDSDFADWNSNHQDIARVKKSINTLENFAKMTEFLFPDLQNMESFNNFKKNMKATLIGIESGDFTIILDAFSQSIMSKEVFISELGRFILK